MKIMVTGGTGFLGTSLSRRLQAEGHEVIRFGSHECDLTDSRSLERFNELELHQIYHLAAWTQAGDFCLHHPGEQWIKNQQINTNVLTWWHRRQPQAKLIAMGTSCAYPCDRELTEENYLEGQPTPSLFTYAMTKRMLYVGLDSLHKQFDLQYLCLVPSTLFGPGYHTDGRQMHFIFDLIRKILTAQRFGTPVVLWGDGEQRREIVYLDDFLELTLRLSRTVSNTLVNIGAGQDFSIRQFAAMICNLVGYDVGLVRYDTSKYVGARSKCLSVKKLRSLAGEPEFVSVSEGLMKTIAWFNEHPELLEPARLPAIQRGAAGASAAA